MATRKYRGYLLSVIMAVVLVTSFLGFQASKAHAAPAYPSLDAKVANMNLRLPWQSGSYSVTGNSYGCGDHNTTWDQDALDFGLPVGTPMVAVGDGYVHMVANDTSGYGNYIALVLTDANKNLTGYTAFYAHMGDRDKGTTGFEGNNLTDGQWVTEGTYIGTSGDQGNVSPPNAQGAHLHFSLRTGFVVGNAGSGTGVAPEPMGGNYGFGHYGFTVDHSCGYIPGPSYSATTGLPGGWYIGPTPSDGSVVPTFTPLQINVRAVDDTGSGLTKVNITEQDPSGNWQILKSVTYTNKPTRQDVYTTMMMPIVGNVLISFDVYSSSGTNYAPNGVRRFCTASPCTPYSSAGSLLGGFGGSDAGVMLCTNTNNSGQCHTFPPGVVSDLSQYGLSGNVNSIQVPSSYTLYLNDGVNLSGTPGVFNASVPDLSVSQWNNRAKSLKIETTKDTSCNVDPTNSNGMILYRDTIFRTGGGCMLISGSVNDLGPSTFVGFSSLRFVGSYALHYKATVYTDANYGTACGSYWLDQSDLLNCAGKVVSVKLEPYTPPQQANNIAIQATRDQSGSDNVVDGDLSTEWKGGNKQTLGFVWNSPQTIQDVVVFDRAQNNPDNNGINKVQLVFSDGTTINNIDMNSGGARCADVSFSAKPVTWVNVVPTDASGNNGYKEVQVWDNSGTPYSTNNCVNKLSLTPQTGSGPAPLINPSSVGQAPTLTKFDDFESGINWNLISNTAGVTAGPNTFLRFSPPAQGAAEANKNVGTAALANDTAITLVIDLHGTTLGANDASALYLDQGGWKYVSLSNYVQQGLDGWQSVTIPLTDFQGFNKAQSFATLGFRFWMPQAATIEIDEVSFMNPNGVQNNSNSVQLLTNPWHLTGNNGAAEASQTIDSNVLNGKDTIQITYNLHGLTALTGDASAIIFEQPSGTWIYISLSDYGQNGLDGEQTVDIPLSKFSGLNLTQPVGTNFHTRFWYSGSFTVDITSVVVFHS